MREFLKGWRRKIGCLTLVLALVFMAGWLRSLVSHDDVQVFVGNTTIHEIHSSGDGFVWMWTSESGDSPMANVAHPYRILLKPSFWVFFERSGGKTVSWNSMPASTMKNEELSTGYDFEKSFPNARWYWNWIGCRFGFEATEGQIYRATVLTAPYWSLVVPLTLISFWLLLSKPRPSTERKTQEPTSIEGGAAS